MSAANAIFAEILENFNQKRAFLRFIRVKCAFLTCFCVFLAYIFAFYRLNTIKNCSIHGKMQENHAKLLKIALFVKKCYKILQYQKFVVILHQISKNKPIKGGGNTIKSA